MRLPFHISPTWRKRLTWGCFLAPLVYAGLVRVLQAKLIYMARSHSDFGAEQYYERLWRRASGTLTRLGRELVLLRFDTGLGEQTAVFISPPKGIRPSHVWLTLGGNAMLARDWLPSAGCARVVTAAVRPAQLERALRAIAENVLRRAYICCCFQFFASHCTRLLQKYNER